MSFGAKNHMTCVGRGGKNEIKNYCILNIELMVAHLLR